MTTFHPTSRRLRPAALVAAAALGLSALAAHAQPSAYFVWKHKTNGKTMCEPDADPTQWTRMAGPFQDSHCKEPLPQ
jgi:hypothetical protein